ncbi:MAG: CHASE2 domain-containing protein [Alkalinema sp. RU_4_3]|nr:CHASE2 domain-containing protein [Alkalinema sp. RU_4_3]
MGRIFYTPFSATQEHQHQLSGVEVHANMVSHLLDVAKNDGNLIQFLPDWMECLWLMVVACGGGLLVGQVRQPLKLLLWSGGLLLGVAGVMFGLMMVHLWLPMVAPVTAVLLSMGSVMALQANRDQTQRKMMMVLLGQNTSREIAAALWENRDRLVESGKLPGQALTATMMFTDLQGFSTISERLEPAELMNWLNEYLDVMTEVIHQHGGLVNKFTGDGVFAVFGVPIARIDGVAIMEDAMNAVACAVEMEYRLARLNEGWTQAGLGSVRMRVGICTGEVVVGSLGGRDRMEYGIIGDSVNIASRLESCVKERQPDLCRILIAEETYRVLGDLFPVECWGEMALKGKQQLVGTYRVLREADQSI